MDAVSSKINNKAIIRLVVTTLILAIINTAFYWINDNYVLSGNPDHPHNPPFDNVLIRMTTREICIWLFFLLNRISLNYNNIRSQHKLLLYITLVLDVLTILFAGIRFIWDTQTLYVIYNTLLGFLNSNLFFTILVILHYISGNLKGKEQNQLL